MRILATSRRAGRLLAIGSAVLVPLLLAGCTSAVNTNPTGDEAAPGFVPGQVVTAQGREAASLYFPILVIAFVIFVLVEGILIYVSLRFRRRRTDTGLPPQTHGNNRLEILWTIVPAIIVMGMFIVSLQTLTQIQARAAEPAVTVDVTGFQWQWTFEYKDDGLSYTGTGKTGPEMVLPVGEPVRVRLHAQDVIHSFYVPSFFTKLDAIPGRINELDLLVEQPGTYGGQCAEFCGLDHARMYFTVRAVSPADYTAWVAAEQARKNAPPSPPAGGPGGSPPPGGPPPGGQPQGMVLEIATTADQPIAYDKSNLSAPANTMVTVKYTNDSDIPHDIAFFGGSDASAPRLASTTVEAGPGAVEEVTFTTPATPGAYYFHCDVHPEQMNGTLEVTG